MRQSGAGQRALDLRNVDVEMASNVFVVRAGVFVDGDLPPSMAEELRGEVEQATGLPVQLGPEPAGLPGAPAGGAS